MRTRPADKNAAQGKAQRLYEKEKIMGGWGGGGFGWGGVVGERGGKGRLV